MILIKNLFLRYTVPVLLAILFIFPQLSYAQEDIRTSIVGMTYSRYIELNGGYEEKDNNIMIQAESYIDSDEGYVVDDNFMDSDKTVLICPDEGKVTWSFTVPEAGLYSIRLNYFPIPGKGSSIERMIEINGEVPFSEARNISFSRIWKDDSEISQDSRGNDIRPRQSEHPEWVVSSVKDSFGYYNEPFKFYFKEGINTLSVVSVREPVAIEWIELFRPDPVLKYEEMIDQYRNKEYVMPAVEPVVIQAEKTYAKSDVSIYPINDRTSPETYPQDVSKLKLNTIGRQKWQMPGQWIKWKFNVPESGLYEIGTRYKQDIMSGVYVSRRVILNGELPFKEAGNIRFNYSERWQVESFNNGNTPYLFYLEEGENELHMEVTLGDLASVLRTVENSMYTMNEIYRNLLMIIGATPDIYRDYGFKRLIPEVIEQMKTQSDILYSVSNDLEAYTGQKGEHVVLLDKIAFQLNEMWEDPNTIAAKFNSFKGNIGALGTWILHTRQQPLELDYLIINPANKELPKSDASFIRRFLFEFGAFIMSFFEDYNSIGTIYDDKNDENVVEVWIATGRDQAQVIKNMLDDSFTPENNIRANLKLVGAGTLLPSTLAGIGPDVSISNTITDPINFAVRGAVEDLTKFPDFEEISKRFHPSSMKSYTLNGSVFALPETQSFPMFFYRTDIFSELNLSVPKTWEEFYTIIPELQKRNMEIAFPAGLPGFQIFLYQMGEGLYREDGARTNIDSEKALQAFEKMSEMYTLFKFPVAYDFANRFRIGEMPAGVVDYTMYNQLTVFAPEIRGLWEFVPLPGTKMADGSINNTSPVVGGGSASVLLSNAKNRENAWKFIKWWTSSNAQSRFGVEMESLLGPAAKHPTANMEALESMPWSARDYRNLIDQWKNVGGTPEVPGGYYTQRSVDFAFRRVYNTGDNPADTLLEYVEDINNEISRKRREFGLE